jgi:hypothetical protein
MMRLPLDGEGVDENSALRVRLSTIYMIRSTECPKSLEPMGILFINLIFTLYAPYVHPDTLCIFSAADFSQRIGIDSSTTVCNSLPKVTKISNFNSKHLCLQETPKYKVSTLSSNVNAILTFNFNL